MLVKYRDGDGEVSTQALAGAVAGLRGGNKERVRNILIDRLARLPAGALREKLHNDDPEVRRAAVFAWPRNERKEADRKR